MSWIRQRIESIFFTLKTRQDSPTESVQAAGVVSFEVEFGIEDVAVFEA